MIKKITLSIIMLVSINMIITAQLYMEELGHLPYTSSLSDIWGYADEEGNEYALVGTYNGLSIVDVTDPANLQEVFFGAGAGSIWRDIKTWGDYAYVSNESNGGIFIVDMSPLPNGNITSTNNFTGSQYSFSSAHNIYIDETGKLYIFGSNSGSGGAIICDLTADPMNPLELGRYNGSYFHDGMARGDTLWGGAIYNGQFEAIDVSDPSNPVLMATQQTPSYFTHNCWISDDGDYLFTTDEVSDGYIGAYDVSDFSNIFEIDRIQSSPGNDIIPHNTHYLNGFLITSYYADGVVIHDVSRPWNMIEVGNYDTSPGFSGSGYNGSWGAYPYAPSGYIYASDIEEGLYILSAEYLKACYVEGMVHFDGTPLNNVSIEIVGTEFETSSNFNGEFAFGTPLSGTYDLQFTDPDNNVRTIPDVELINGELSYFDIDFSDPPASVTQWKNNVAFKLFPNPFAESVQVDYNFENINSDAAIIIYTLYGSKISHHNLTVASGIVKIGEELEKGIYIIQVTNGLGDIRNMKVNKI